MDFLRKKYFQKKPAVNDKVIYDDSKCRIKIRKTAKGEEFEFSQGCTKDHIAMVRDRHIQIDNREDE